MICVDFDVTSLRIDQIKGKYNKQINKEDTAEIQKIIYKNIIKHKDRSD